MGERYIHGVSYLPGNLTRWVRSVMSQQIIIDYWVEKAEEDLASARDNLKSGRYQNAVRDAYFACFHALSSVLLNEGKTFKKHKKIT